MAIKYQGQEFLSDDDLKVKILGFWPRVDIKNPELKERFTNEVGSDFLGGDELVAYAQTLVSSGMNFEALENQILTDMIDPEGIGLREIIRKKTASGIGRGHSLGGLSGVVLGINGTKMIDSGLTGLVASRSLVTSSRRRETKTEEIAVPKVLALAKNSDLLDEYLTISKDVLEESGKFKEKFGNMKGVETFNKVIPYNNPADLFIVLPLDSLATLCSEVEQDKKNANGNFVPRELYSLVDCLPEITKATGIDIMFGQRTRVPRDTYLHYTVFKDPSLPNYALEKAAKIGMPHNPAVISKEVDLTPGFKNGFEHLYKTFEKARQTTNPEELVERAKECMLEMREFVGEYNEAVRVKVIDSLSWRVWSEQKRHATLRQNVESVYSGAQRSLKKIKDLWPVISLMYNDGGLGRGEFPFSEVDKFIVVDERLKQNPELALSYIYHTGRQLLFYEKLLKNGIEERDALYIMPKNIKLRTLENYDLINLIDLEFPLRLCSTCEPERQATSWKKREVLANAIPDFDYFLQPKCGIGMCTEGKFCGRITSMRKDYSDELHKAAKKAMLGI